MFSFRTSFLIALVAVLSSCRKDVGSVSLGSYPVEIGRIMVNTCAATGCHDDISNPAAGSLNLSTWQKMFSGSSSGSPVIPYSSRFSSLCYAINTYPDLGAQTQPSMPLNKNPLSYSDVKKIEDWIDSGAPDIHGNIVWSEPQRKKLYAVNQGCDVVTVFDSETQLPIRYIDVGRPGVPDTPHQIRVSPDGKYWYVIFVNYNVMEKYSCDTDKKVGEVSLGNIFYWNTLNISADGKRGYSVSFESTGHVVSVDLVNMQLIHTLLLPGNPHGIAIGPGEANIYVAYQYGNAITQIDTSFSNSPNDISLDGNPVTIGSNILDPHDMILTPDGGSLMITCEYSNEVRSLDLSTNSVTAVMSVGAFPQEITYSPSMQKYFVSCMYDASLPGAYGSVCRIDPNGYTVTKVKCGYEPHGIAVDERTKLLYVLSRNIGGSGPAPHHTSQCAGRNGFVNFIDLNSFTVQGKKYELSVDPYFVAARP
jgi:YVTN family beta-propeller protein